MSSVAPNPGYGQFLTPGQQPYQSIYKSSPSPNSSSNDYHSKTIDPHASSRTPSPTPSEVEELKKGAVDWRSMLNWRFWVRREWLCKSYCLSFVQDISQVMFRVLCRSCYHPGDHSARCYISYTNR